jgi:hypothetical protein
LVSVISPSPPLKPLLPSLPRLNQTSQRHYRPKNRRTRSRLICGTTRRVRCLPSSSFFDANLSFRQIFPIRVGIWDVRYLLSRLQQADLLDQIRELVPKDAAYDVKVESVEPRAKDGGAFVRFSFKVPEKVWAAVDGVSAEGETDEALKQSRLREVEAKIAKIIEDEAVRFSSFCSSFVSILTSVYLQGAALEKSGWKPWFALGRPSKAFLVRGRPWMEDMNRFPSREIRVEYEGPAVRLLRLSSMLTS